MKCFGSSPFLHFRFFSRRGAVVGGSVTAQHNHTVTPVNALRFVSSHSTFAVVATPIGNLRDITLRALDALADSTIILCEDTRVTAKLLYHYKILGQPDITTPSTDQHATWWAMEEGGKRSQRQLVSLHEHNEAARISEVLQALAAGHSVALVCDAGTPAVSDPGARVVAAARAAGFEVVAIPGPCAATAALSIAGCDWSPGGSGDCHVVGASSATTAQPSAAGRTCTASCAGALLLGFLPPPGPLRSACVAEVTTLHRHRTVVLYEAPVRVHATLGDLAAAAEGRSAAMWGSHSSAAGGAVEARQPTQRLILVCRELTKMHEEVVRFDSIEAAAAAVITETPSTGARADAPPGRILARGEFTLVLLPEQRATETEPHSDDPLLEATELARALVGAGASTRDAARRVADICGVGRKALYGSLLGIPPRA